MTTTWNSTIAQIQTSDIEFGVKSLRQMYGRDATVNVDDEPRWTSNVASMGPVCLYLDRVNVHARLLLTFERYTFLGTRERSHHVHKATSQPVGSTHPGAVALLHSPGERVVVDCEPGLRSRNVTITREFLLAQFEALTGENITELRFEEGVDLQKPTGGLIEQLCVYLDHLIDNGTPSLPAALTSSLCESLSRALLTGQPHTHSYLLDKPAPPSSRTIVRMVEEYLDAHAGGPVVASDLAQLTGVPMRSIDAAFLQHRQSTSLAFLRQRRLEHARLLLLENRLMPMMQVAQAAGYLRVQTFEDVYFKTFKETPLETRRRGFVGAASGARLSRHETVSTPEARLSLLTDREKLICARLIEGQLNKQIAAELGIAERTVKHQRSVALKKLGVTSTVDLVKLWPHSSK